MFRFRGRARHIVLNALRHQRGRHKLKLRLIDAAKLCSTPCGIKEVGTSGGCTAGRPVLVLNALRHQRGRHNHKIVALADELAVLNALRHQRGRHRSVRPLHQSSGCAQRLAASKRSAQLSGHAPDSSDEVLNALRHQRGRHLRAGGLLTEKIEVLNALRHHRGRHAAARSEFEAGLACSTPCGITEVGTGSSGRTTAALHECSTPCGITEVGTAAAAPVHRGRDRGAQRLAASQRSAHAQADLAVSTRY